ncbi:MAG: ABC transporter substrate-binding protein [Ornithinimicrobium sp.]
MSHSTMRLVAAMSIVAMSVTACSSSRPDDEGSAGAEDSSSEESAAEDSSEATEVPEPAAASEDYTLSFIQGVAGDEFYISMQCGAEAEAEKLGVTVNTQGPQKFDPTLQKPIVDSVVASQPDALMIAPTDVTAMQGPLNQAAEADVEVVLVDTTLEDPSMAASAIASDNEGGGTAAFEAIKELNPDGGKVIVISTDPGISTVDARIKGFEEAVGQDPDFEYVGVQYSRNDPATASQLISSALQKDPDIVGVFATNLFSAEGTANGIRQSGNADQVQLVTFDAGPNQVKALKEGTVQALIAQQPALIGKYGVDAAVAALEGEAPPKMVQTGFTVITSDNVDTTGADAVYQSSC